MKYIFAFIVCMLFWVLITLNLSKPYLITGLGASFFATLFFGRYFLKGWTRFLNPVRYFWAILYIPVFVWECIKANFDVAYRVIHPALPIKPGIVKVKTGLKTDIARVFLANSITMTPGTLSVDIIGENLYIHWINVTSTNPAVYTDRISGRFEKFLKRIFE